MGSSPVFLTSIESAFANMILIDKNPNVKSEFFNINLGQALGLGKCHCYKERVSLLHRHGGLLRHTSSTVRLRSGRLRCPQCGKSLPYCAPSVDREAMQNTALPDWHLDLDHYDALVGMHGIPEANRPCLCPECRLNKRKPHRHSHFWRNVFTLLRSARIQIFRFRCPDCRYVFSVIPAFLEPYQQVALDLQEELLHEIEQGTTMEAVAEATDALPDTAYSTRTIGRWVQRWKERLVQLEPGWWPWLIARLPHLTLPRSSSLWRVWHACWEMLRHHFPVWHPIRFLQGLNRLYLSLTVAGEP